LFIRFRHRAKYGYLREKQEHKTDQSYPFRMQVRWNHILDGSDLRPYSLAQEMADTFCHLIHELTQVDQDGLMDRCFEDSFDLFG
jgi:hypothetical protein